MWFNARFGGLLASSGVGGVQVGVIASWFLNAGTANTAGTWVDLIPWNNSFFLSTGVADYAGLWDDAQVWS